MCGIVGVFSRAGAPIDRDDLVAMRDSMLHRGPDDEGLWLRDGRADVGFGHRRLSIVDLSELGRQPMTNETGDVQLVFNGEIYNHELLRPDLERRGHVFRSRCDSEVLVHLWEEYGPRMVDRLVGMFTIGIWDERRQTLFLARDRLGIKPLYWVDTGETFAFASEIKALLPLLPRREIDPTALAHYLTFVAVPPPRTLFAGVHKLAPASTMLVRRDGPEEPERYWDPIANRADFDGADVDWVAEFRHRLARSIDRRMMSDVPVGRVPVGRRRLVEQRRADEPARRPPDQHLLDRVRGRRALQRVRLGAADRRPVRDEPPRGADRRRRTCGTSSRSSCTTRTSRSPTRCACRCTSWPSWRRTTASPWCTSARAPTSSSRATRPTSRRTRSPPGRGGACARCRARCARSSRPTGSRVLGTRPGYELHSEVLNRAGQPDGQLWWGGAVAFYERGFDRVTTPELRAGGRRASRRATSSPRSAPTPPGPARAATSTG